MSGRYKVTGIDPGETALELGRCLTMRKSRDVVNTPGMYAKVRHSTMGWMNSAGATHNLMLFEELFASEVVLDYMAQEPREHGDAMESGVLVAALLIAFPDARFGLGLPGSKESLGVEHYRSLGKQSVPLREGSDAREFLTQLFDYLRRSSYWVDDDLVHMLALLSAVCEDRNRTTPVKVLSLSTSGNHQVDAGLFHAYQLVEALLELRNGESFRKAVVRWNARYPYKLDADQIDFIKYVRDVSLHFKVERAGPRLRESRKALGFDRDRSREHEFRQYGMQRLLRETAQAYFCTRL